MSLASEARREAPAQAELRPSAPGELIQAKRCASLAFRAPGNFGSSLLYS